MKTHGGLTESLTEHSVRTHVATHDRKGREGKGIGIEDVSPHPSAVCNATRIAPVAAWFRQADGRASSAVSR